MFKILTTLYLVYLYRFLEKLHGLISCAKLVHCYYEYQLIRGFFTCSLNVKHSHAILHIHTLGLVRKCFLSRGPVCSSQFTLMVKGYGNACVTRTYEYKTRNSFITPSTNATVIRFVTLCQNAWDIYL